MLNKHKVEGKQRQQQQQLAEMMAALRRVSGRAAAGGVKNYASLADADSDEEGTGGQKKGGEHQLGQQQIMVAHHKLCTCCSFSNC